MATKDDYFDTVGMADAIENRPIEDRGPRKADSVKTHGFIRMGGSKTHA